MKAKTIKSVLRKKFNAWVESISDAAVRDAVKGNTIITGGSIASMLLGEHVNDFDLYFRDHATTLAVAKYYVGQFTKNPPPRFKNSDTPVEIRVVWEGSATPGDSDRIKIVVQSAGIAGETEQNNYRYFEYNPDPENTDPGEYVEAAQEVANDADTKPDFRPVFLTTNAITLSGKVQVIIRFYGEPDQIHENYDFVHCMNYWDSGSNALVLRPEAIEALLTKELRYNGSRYPICSIIRTRKFLARGWTINAGQYLKMAWQVGSLDLQDIAVLEDQLVGVDTAYFMELISKLREKFPAGTPIDNTYLMEIIDTVF